MTRVIGIPHELLHVLALLLIRRRPTGIGLKHVDVPDDLSTRQYIFVAAFPTLAFLLLAAVGLVLLMNAASVLTALAGIVLVLLGMLGMAGGVGDVQLIQLRLARDRMERSPEDTQFR
ncbi:MAG: DUF3267 domain-containing protein [Pleurocapsa minor GSE-CHR-MK-17-07R]|jgi:hypothetical protein|nr:DUF3267 domain-containing protein [Pleurocapsa minor GSE-CHR-MK 17-07R]